MRPFNITSNRKGPGPYQLQKLKSIHKRIANASFLGYKDKDIASALGITPQMVAYTRKSELVQRHLGLLEGVSAVETLEIAHELKELAPIALRKLEVLMLKPTGDEKLQASIAQDLLDRAGHTSVRRLQVASSSMTDDEIMDIKARANGSGIIAEIADAEIVSDDPVSTT